MKPDIPEKLHRAETAFRALLSRAQNRASRKAATPHDQKINSETIAATEEVLRSISPYAQFCENVIGVNNWPTLNRRSDEADAFAVILIRIPNLLLEFQKEVQAPKAELRLSPLFARIVQKEIRELAHANNLLISAVREECFDLRRDWTQKLHADPVRSILSSPSVKA